MKRLVAILLALAVMTAALAGCAGSTHRDTAEPMAEGATADYTVAAEAKTGAPAAPQGGMTASADAAAQGERQPASLPDMSVADQKLVLNAQFEIRVEKSVEDAAFQIRQAVLAAGGYVQESRQQGSRQQGRTLHMTLRVPAGQYNDIVELITNRGEVRDRREWTTDVTEQYVDLEARIESQEKHLERLRELYDRSGSITELIELEREIARATAELESLKGRFQVLNNRVAFSTIIVSLYEPGVPEPIREPRTIWERVKQGFIGSWNGVVNFTAEMIVLVAAALPVLAYLGVLGGIGYGIYRLMRPTLNRRRPPKPPAAPTEEETAPDKEPKA